MKMSDAGEQPPGRLRDARARVEQNPLGLQLVTDTLQEPRKAALTSRRRFFHVHPRQLVGVGIVHASCREHDDLSGARYAVAAVVVVGKGRARRPIAPGGSPRRPTGRESLRIGRQQPTHTRRIQVEIEHAHPFARPGSLDRERGEDRAATEAALEGVEHHDRRVRIGAAQRGCYLVHEPRRAAAVTIEHDQARFGVDGAAPGSRSLCRDRA